MPLIVEAPASYPPMLAEMLQFVAETLVSEGLAEMTARHVAFATCERVRKEYGGHTQYVPAGNSYELSLREEEVYAKFNGNNFDQLATEFGVSTRWVRHLVKRANLRDKMRRQTSLPGVESARK